jgi:hypothetical protein
MGLVDGGIRCPSDILRILAKSESGQSNFSPSGVVDPAVSILIYAVGFLV